MQTFGNMKIKHFSATQREVPQCELWGRIDQGDDHVQVSSYYSYLLLSINVQSASLKHNMKKLWLKIKGGFGRGGRES